MDKQKYLYVMISETDTGVGRIIRHLSNYRYNHVSLTTDPGLRTWYSFARYYENTPFYSGFVREPVERFLARGYEVPVRIFRLPIEPDRCRMLELLFHQAGRSHINLCYNYYDVLAAIFRRKISIPGAYTCLGFCCAVLEKNYVTIEDLNADLLPFLFFDGDLAKLVPDSGDRSDPYFFHLGTCRGFWYTACSMAHVGRRMLCDSAEDPLEDRLHSTAH